MDGIISFNTTRQLRYVSGACLFDYRIFKFPALSSDHSARYVSNTSVGSKMACAHHLFTKQTLITSFYKLNQSPAHLIPLFVCFFSHFCYWNYFFMCEFFFYYRCFIVKLCCVGVNGVLVVLVRLCVSGSDLFNVQKHYV